MNAEITTERTQEEAAAVTLLKSTGIGVLVAAQVVCAVVARLRRGGYIAEASVGGGQVIMQCENIVDAGLQALSMRERTVSFAEAGWASVEARHDCRATTRRDLRYFLRKLLNVPQVAELPLRAMTTAQCREILQQAFGHSKSMYIKGRAMLHSVFAYGVRREWCDANPVARIEVPRVVEAPKAPLAPEEVQRLQQVVEQPRFRDMKLSVNLLLYSGIRPAEVSRLRAEDFCWRERVVIVRPQKSKTGGGRVVPLRGVKQLAPQERLIPKNWQRRWRELRQAAGFAHWVPHVCRHTFASYHASYFRHLPELQLEMGHRDCTLLRTRYMSPMLRKEARRFWARVR